MEMETINFTVSLYHISSNCTPLSNKIWRYNPQCRGQLFPELTICSHQERKGHLPSAVAPERTLGNHACLLHLTCLHQSNLATNHSKEIFHKLTALTSTVVGIHGITNAHSSC